MAEKNIFKMEKGTKWTLSGFIFLISLGYIFSSLGKSDWTQWTSAGLGILFGVFIFSEAGVLGYIKNKGWKKITFSDIVVWVSFMLGTILIVNSFLIIQSIREYAPMWLTNFLGLTGAIAGGLAGIFAILMLFTKKPTA
ncbi:MAG: hypothetical protein WC979_09095 [Candidatus Pacearchaeota archaeon]|jgi:hypothetical protein